MGGKHFDENCDETHSSTWTYKLMLVSEKMSGYIDIACIGECALFQRQDLHLQ